MLFRLFILYVFIYLVGCKRSIMVITRKMELESCVQNPNEAAPFVSTPLEVYEPIPSPLLTLGVKSRADNLALRGNQIGERQSRIANRLCIGRATSS